MASLTVPIPPSVNNLYATVRGRRVLSAEGRRYKANVALMARAKRIQPIMTGDVRVDIVVYRKRNAGDLDNYCKSLLDALKGVAWTDDSQIKFITAVRYQDRDNPRVVIGFEPFEVGFDQFKVTDV